MLKLIALLLIASPAHAFKVCWTNPTENVDGSPVESLSEIRISFGAEPRTYTRTIPVTGAQQLAVGGTNLCLAIRAATGTYFVAATAVDSDGGESAYSNEVIKEETRLGGPSGGSTLQGPSGGTVITEGN